MPVVISPDSEMGKELEKWNTPKRLGGMRCDGIEPYPAMVYRAERYPGTGKVMCMHPLAGTGDAVVDAFSVRCYKEVRTPEAHDQANREGWSDDPLTAIKVFEKAATAEADAAANAAYHAKRMSEKAQREFDAAQETADFHVPDPPAPPKRPRDAKGRLLPAIEPTDPAAE
jgi:hypothetical protein